MTFERSSVFLDISLNGEGLGRIVIELFDDVTPKTSLNFKTLCIGTTKSASGTLLSFKKCSFHRVIKSFMIQGGDFTNHNGTGGESIFGERFDDENFEFKHDKPGLLSMANAGPNTNGSQFFITTVPTPHLDNKHVVFGRVSKGMGIVRMIENCEKGQNDAPLHPIIIEDCGIFTADMNKKDNDDGDIYEEYPEDQKGENEFTVAEVIAISGSIKLLGNALFKQGDIANAKKKYEKALRYLSEIDDQGILNEKSVAQDQLKEFFATKTSCLLNGAMWGPAISKTSKVISYHDSMSDKNLISSSDRCKALFRRGLALNAVKDYDSALKDLQIASNLSPEDSLITREFNIATKKIKERGDREKKMYSKMFSK